MNKTILDKIKGMKSTVSDDFNEVTKSVNSLTTDTYNTLSKSLDDVTNIKNKISVISDMFTDLRVLNGTAKNMVYLSTLPIVENSGIKVKDDKFTLDTLIKTNKEIYVKDSSISSVEKYKLYTLDGKGTVLDTFLKSGVETLVQFDNTRYTFTLNLKYTSMEQINSVELQLGLLTESYPIINSIKYVDKDNVEKTAVILNNTSTSYDLDYNREVDNKYTLDISPIFTNQINIELTSKTNSNVILKDIKTYFKKEVQVAEIIVGPIHTEKPLLKVALDCEELTKGCSFELSTDLDYWLKLDSSSIITDELNTKILSFNTINEKSIKTKEDIYTFYIKISVESTLLTNDDVNTNIYNTLREDHSISNETLEIVDDNLFSAYKVKSSDFIHGKYQYIENLNLKDLSKENIEYIEVNGISKVLGLVESPYSITDKSENNGGGVGGELKLKRLPADFLIDSTRYDLANAKVHDIFLRNTEETINTREKDNLCLTLKRKKILVVEPDFTAPYNVTATVTDEEDFSAPYDINSTIEENNENIITDDLFTKATYIKTDDSNPMWIGAEYAVENASGQLHIDWGDGVKELINVADYINDGYSFYPEHQYAINGEYVVKVYSTTKAYTILLGEITKVTDWGKPSSQLLQLSSANLIEVPSTLHPDITDLSFMFQNATSFNQDISVWDVSKVTSMTGTFSNASIFNQDISNWDVSNVTDMARMFEGAYTFNQPIGNWNVSNVNNMSRMFNDTRTFNQPLNTWNVSKVSDMYAMFQQAFDFNQDLSLWCVPLITEEPLEFKLGSALTEEYTPVWGTCPVEVELPPADTNAAALQFKVSCPEGYSESYLLVNNWDFEEGTVVTIDWGDGSPIETFTEITFGNAYHEYPPSTNTVCKLNANKTLPMFWLNSDAVTEIVSFGTFGITNPKFSFDELVKVPDTLPSFITDMTEMFYQCRAFNDPTIINWDTSHVTKMSAAFIRSSIFNQPIGNWDTSNVTEMWDMFTYCDVFNQPIGNWDVSNVTDMTSMFYGTGAFNQNLSHWCVGLIPTLPFGFADGATLFTVDKHPIWGTCPSGVSVPKANEMEFTTISDIIDYEGVVGDQIIFSDGTTITLDEGYLYDIAAPAGKHKVVLKEPREATHVGIGGEGLIELHNFPTLSSIDSFNFYPNNASTNLVKVPTVLPPNIVYTVRMFSKASAFNQDISMWDTSNVKYMYYMFSDATSFNQPLNSWNTSNVLDMSYIFRGATNFNQPIGTWDTSNVAYMQYMFRLSTSFAQDLSQWCVPSVTSKPISFDESAPLFTVDKHPVWGTCPRGENQVTIPSNEMHFTTLAGSADYVGTQGDQILLSDGTIVDVTATDEQVTFDVSAGRHKVKLVESVDRHNFVSVGGEALVELHNFPTLSTVTKFNFSTHEYKDAPNLTKVPEHFPSNIIDIEDLFNTTANFNQDISMWDVSNVKIFNYVFSMTGIAFNQPLNSWDVSSATSMRGLFCGATTFNYPLDSWNVSNVTVMSRMFDGATAFNQDLSQWCVGLITSLPSDFATNAPLFTTDKHPVWGTCPRGENVV